ncbi:MAG: hypothetical protein PVG93_04905 [Phycisphaerales bacterium]|jgi:hypothetical protein
MKKLSLAIVLLSLISSGNVFASHDWFHQVGKWSDSNKWTGDGIPDGNGELRIRYDDSHCVLDSNAGDWTNAQRLRVYGDANLVIVDGAKLLGVSWMRVGTGEGPGEVGQVGGMIFLKGGKDNSRLTVGYEKGSAGSQYTISGGTLTYYNADADLIVGYRGGEGKFTVVGTKPKIKMRRLYVGGDLVSKAGTGTLEFVIDSGGVSPIQLAKSVHLDREGDESEANLIVRAMAAPPKADIVLVEDTNSGRPEGKFDVVIDAKGNGPGKEGTPVVINFDGKDYHYQITYRYQAGKDNIANDIALKYMPEQVAQSGAAK